METTTQVRKEFLRKVYRASAGSESARKAYIDGLADSAITLLNSGKTLSGASGGGFNSSYSVFSGWDPSKILELCDWARSYVSESTADLAVASVSPGVVRFRSNFTQLFVQ